MSTKPNNDENSGAAESSGVQVPRQEAGARTASNGLGEATSEAPLPPATGSAQHRHLWHNDLCEWYVVCSDCYHPESRNQWGGSTGSRLRPYEREYFRQAAREDYETATKCQWCKRPLIPLEKRS